MNTNTIDTNGIDYTILICQRLKDVVDTNADHLVSNGYNLIPGEREANAKVSRQLAERIAYLESL